MKKGRFAQLRGYFNHRVFYSRIKSAPDALEEKNGALVYCDKCGNMANGVLQVWKRTGRGEGTFNLPLCKKHFQEVRPKNGVFPIIAAYKRPERERMAVTRSGRLESTKLVYIQYPNPI